MKFTSPLVAPQIAPQGEVRQESVVRVRFDEPMVKLSRVGVADKVPATIAPPTSGTWRWIDTRVLTFTASGSRLPAATEFVVTVPAGTRALSGASLTADEKVKFATSAVEIAGQYPATRLRPDSAIAVNFDQDIDAGALLPFLRVVTEKGRPLAFKAVTLATAEAIWKRNPTINDNASLGAHRVILAPETEWPAGSDIRVVLSKGAPSKEGPRLTARESFVQFEIAPSFAVKGVTCDEMFAPRMAGAYCPVNYWLQVQFSNSIETKFVSFR